MTDLNKLRSEFEKYDEIKTHLNHGNVFWSEDHKIYASEFRCLHAVACYVNGAWMMFQEKAKAQAVPEGYISVPKYATKEMVNAGYESHDGFYTNGQVQDVYQAMIKARESGDEG